MAARLSLSEKQRAFTLMVAEFIVWCSAHGYELTFGEAYRTPEQAKWNAAEGKGIVKSLHCERLALDLNLFVQGVYRSDTEAYRPLGERWESMGGSWGGRFSKPDGNHFSLSHEGVR